MKRLMFKKKTEDSVKITDEAETAKEAIKLEEFLKRKEKEAEENEGIVAAEIEAEAKRLRLKELEEEIAGKEKESEVEAEKLLLLLKGLDKVEAEVERLHQLEDESKEPPK